METTYDVLFNCYSSKCYPFATILQTSFIKHILFLLYLFLVRSDMDNKEENDGILDMGKMYTH